MKKAVLKSILLSHHFNYFTLSTGPLFICFPWKLFCLHLQQCCIFSYFSPVWGFNLLTPSHSRHSPMTADFLQRPVWSSKSLFRCHFYCSSYRDAVNSAWPHAGKNRKSVFSVIVLSLNSPISSCKMLAWWGFYPPPRCTHTDSAVSKLQSSYALWRNTTWYTMLAAMHKNNSVWCPKAFPKLEKDVAPQRLTPLLKHLSSLQYSNYGTNSSSAWSVWICTSYRFSLLSFQIAADGEVPTPEAVDRILKGIS